jgi:hypothetical protein
MLARVRATARPTCQSAAAALAIRTDMGIGANGGSSEAMVLRVLSGLPKVTNTSRYDPSSRMVVGAMAPWTSCWRETSAASAAYAVA